MTDLVRGGKVYFSHAELACPATGVAMLNDQFAIYLIDLRLAYAREMLANSCCRSAAYNASIKGHDHSLHVFDEPYHDTDGTAAIDIRWPADPGDRVDLVRIALEKGWSVGVAKSFVHFDRRDIAGLPQMLFGYRN